MSTFVFYIRNLVLVINQIYSESFRPNVHPTLINGQSDTDGMIATRLPPDESDNPKVIF